MKFLKLIFLMMFVFLVSCGSDSEESALITYIITVNQGEINEILYLDGQGNEVQTNGIPGKQSFTVTFPAPEGTYLLLSAAASLGGDEIDVKARILSNGQLIEEGSNSGEDGPPALRPQITVEGFATIPQSEDQTTN